MTRSGLARALQATFPHLARAEARLVVEALFSSLQDALVRGRSVELRGFGTFYVRRSRGRVRYDPHRKVRRREQPQRYPYFRPARALKKRFILFAK